jgi:hypothetical protein
LTAFAREDQLHRPNPSRQCPLDEGDSSAILALDGLNEAQDRLEREKMPSLKAANAIARLC